MRILLFTGKGGVGKTTTAAATALHLSRAGHRTLLTSADPAHSLADSLDVELAGEPSEVAPGCWAQQIDARERLEESWGDLRSWILDVLHWAGVAELEAEELAVVPGLDELFALTDLQEHAASGAYDVVVVDCAPTAETVRLLSLPEILSWYMDKLYPASRRVSRVVAPVLRSMTSLPVAGDEVFEAGLRVHEQLDAVRRLLADPAVTSARLVVNPERMVVAEARRTYTYLSLFGYRVDAVVVNRLLPEGPGDAFLSAWREDQRRQMATIEEAFSPLPILTAAHAGNEVVGREELDAFARDLWGSLDPAAHLVDGSPLRLDRRGDDVVLRIELPFTGRDEIDLTTTADELFVAVGPHRRSLVLPESLRGRAVTAAALDEGSLEVRFGRDRAAGGA